MTYLVTPVELRAVQLERVARAAPATASGARAAPLERHARVRTTVLVPARR